MRRARRNLYALKRERREKREYIVGSRSFSNRIRFPITIYSIFLFKVMFKNVTNLPGHKMRLIRGFDACAVWTINDVMEEAYSGKSPPWAFFLLPLSKMRLASFLLLLIGGSLSN